MAGRRADTGNWTGAGSIRRRKLRDAKQRETRAFGPEEKGRNVRFLDQPDDSRDKMAKLTSGGLAREILANRARDLDMI